MKKIFLIFFISVVFLLGGIGFYLNHFLKGRSPTLATLFFKSGTSLRQISRELRENQVVSNASLFEWMIRILQQEKKLKSGEYEFPKGSTPREVMKMMVEGMVKFYPITIPEGYTLQQIGEIFEQKKLVTKEKWQLLIGDPKWGHPFEIEVSSLEGYLFPDTYLIDLETTVEELLEQMLQQFHEKVSSNLILKAKQKGLTPHQFVTLASIIEKETGKPEERPLIAAVFLNRLKIGMPLQTDPTVIYGIPHFNGNLTRRDLETDTPYNTYTRNGLPPGPICSPGLDSLLSVLNPTPVDYLYFVAKGDGTHQFSKTFGEHQKAVQIYQLHQNP